MIPELWFLLILIIFWVVIYLAGYLFHLDKYGLEVKPAYFMYKSEKLTRFLDKASKRRQFFWKTFSNIGIAFALGLMIFCIYFFASNLLKFIYPVEVGTAVPIIPILPVITVRLYWLPYFFTAIAIAVLTHEFAHGIIARLEKIPVKSAGILMAFIFFGGFVEPDEEGFEKTSTLSKLRMLAVGSSTNLITSFLVLLLLTGLYAPASGILIYETTENGPVARAGLQQWDHIYGVSTGTNETMISTVYDLADFIVLNNVTLGDTLLLRTNKGNMTIKTENGSGGQAVIGIAYYSDYYPCRIPLEYYTAIHLHMTLFWLQLISISVAVFNMLPLYPFDGERFLYYFLEKIVKKRHREVRILFNAICFGLIAINIVMSFIRYGLLRL
jgi:membrane-associated protease RseP (regulator of RpoE activity)